MDRIYLYRLIVIAQAQKNLFEEEITREQFLYNLLISKPSEELRQGYAWHIGNVSLVPNDGLSFAVGRTTIASQEKYDQHTGDFLSIHDEESPYTYAIYDRTLGVLGLAPKTKLSSSIKGIASNLQKLLNQSTYTRNNGVHIEVKEIPDPRDFIDEIYEAYSVVGFKMKFGEPNPFDVDQDFHAPMEKLLREVNGRKGYTTLQGDDLERRMLEKLTRSVASTGGGVSARIKATAGAKAVTKNLKEKMPIAASAEKKQEHMTSETWLSRLRAVYNQIRHSDD